MVQESARGCGPNAIAPSDIAPWTPSYRYADLGWRLLDGHSPTAGDLLMLAGYTVVFAFLAARICRLDESREHA